jgi:hypothetical protein
VVQAGGLPELEHADVDPELLKTDVALERAGRPELVAVEPARLARVQDVPAFTLRDEAAFGCNELRFHRRSRIVEA